MVSQQYQAITWTNVESTLVQVMAWCCQATSHYLGQCWPISMLPYGVTRPQCKDFSERIQLTMPLLNWHTFGPDLSNLVLLWAQNMMVIKRKHFLRYWPFVRGIHQSLVDSPHKGPVMQSFDVFFDQHQNKWLSNRSRYRWFVTASHSLWDQCSGIWEPGQYHS